MRKKGGGGGKQKEGTNAIIIEETFTRNDRKKVCAAREGKGGRGTLRKNLLGRSKVKVLGGGERTFDRKNHFSRRKRLEFNPGGGFPNHCRRKKKRPRSRRQSRCPGIGVRSKNSGRGEGGVKISQHWGRTPVRLKNGEKEQADGRGGGRDRSLLDVNPPLEKRPEQGASLGKRGGGK